MAKYRVIEVIDSHWAKRWEVQKWNDLHGWITQCRGNKEFCEKVYARRTGADYVEKSYRQPVLECLTMWNGVIV